MTKINMNSWWNVAARHGAVLLLLVAMLALPAGCGTTNSSRHSDQSRSADSGAGTSTALEFSVAGMSCDLCAREASKVLLMLVPGTTEAKVDFDTKTARLGASAPVTREQVRGALGTLGFEARFAGESVGDSALLPDAIKVSLDIQIVTRGDAIRIADHLVPGKVTIFDYYADWCGPCSLLTPKLERLVQKYENIALRKIDIVKWDSAAARQATRAFGLAGLPFTRILDNRGKVLGEVQGNSIDEIEAIVRRHAAPKSGP